MSSQPTSNPWLTFNCSNLAVREHGGIAPSTIIKASNAFDVSVDCAFDGFLALPIIALYANAPQPPAHWKVEYSAESIGVGPEIALGTKEGSIVAGKLEYKYADTFLHLPANALPVGTYKLVAVVTFSQLPGVTGFVEGPMIQVY